MLDHSPIRPPRASFREEQVYAERWRALMEAPENFDGATPLDLILHAHCAKAGQREASVAASFICWLGTNFGMAFLGEGKHFCINSPWHGYLGAWAIHNRRSIGTNSGFRSIEYLLRTTEEEAQNLASKLSTNDHEVIEHLALWLATEDGQAFISGCETVIARYRKLKMLADYRALGAGDDHPVVRELEAEFATA